MGCGAWPFLVGGVICLVNSVNERYPNGDTVNDGDAMPMATIGEIEVVAIHHWYGVFLGVCSVEVCLLRAAAIS